MHDPNDFTRQLTSAPACPPWCFSPAGHPYTDEAVDGGCLVRYHEDEHDLGDVLPAAPPASSLPVSSVSVVISCEEQSLTDRGPAVQAAPAITLWTENPILTADEARQVSALLLRAAERLDDLLGVQR